MQWPTIPKLTDRLSSSTGTCLYLDVYLPYWTSPHKSMKHTPYKAMLGRAPPSKDGAAIEAILVDKWAKGLHAAQEEAGKEADFGQH